MAKRDVILNNFWWKITALFLAVAAWIGFKSRTGIQLFPEMPTSHSRILVSHPISITKPANDAREVKVQPTTVDITLTGELDALRDLDTREVRATVEIMDMRGETNMLPVKVFLPPQVKNARVEKWVPDTVLVELANLERKL